MKITNIFLEKTNAFSKLFLDYLHQEKSLSTLYNLFPSVQNFEKIILNKAKFSSEKRQLLHRIFTKQYEKIEAVPQKQIDSLLQKNTFCVTTGHQLCLFMGPVYVIYKIVTTILLAEILKKAFPNYHFVPIYWLASEDHDFEEVNHFNLFGKTYTWQTTQKGAVGRMYTQELANLLAEVAPKLAPEWAEKMQHFYLNSANLSEATCKLAHDLFGKEGLLCLDADVKELKNSFIEVLKKDIFEQETWQKVQQTNEKIIQLGYKILVHPREINVFYLNEKGRNRIVKIKDKWHILDTEIAFTEVELQAELEQNAERFSPNVVLRPLYQEHILPNIAYIGGPNELSYWLQFKAIFEAYSVDFPVLVPRNFVLYINKNQAHKLQKLDIKSANLFQDEVALKRFFVQNHTSKDLTLTQEISTLEGLYNQIISKASNIDKSLESMIAAEKHKTLQGLQHLEKRLQKAEEKRQETHIQQLLHLKQKLFPNNDLQERQENWLNFYATNPYFIQDLLQKLNPLHTEMYVMEEE